MPYCTYCESQRRVDEFDINERTGKRKKCCRDCLEKQRIRSLKPPKAWYGPIKWRYIKTAFHLTKREKKAVDDAAFALIAMHEWRKHRRGDMPEIPDTIISGVASHWIRQCELLMASSLRARELLHKQGTDPGAFFNRGERIA